MIAPSAHQTMTTGNLTLLFTGQSPGTPSWGLMHIGDLRPSTAPRITVEELDANPAHPREVKRHVEQVMVALESFASALAATPGRASWLHIHQVPVRRSVAQVVRKLLALSAWTPFAKASGPITVAPQQARDDLLHLWHRSDTAGRARA
ncbi:hypothetical protein ACOZ38_26165 [Sphaerisporangium viridialbum]|uniref:hypothetical protein n=1 Tax=Sphaerisporangium viridialbum TaxID=46189 RepID=UPI003C784ACE